MALSPMSPVGLKVIQDTQHPENAMAMPNSTTCKTKDSATSPDPYKIAEAL